MCYEHPMIFLLFLSQIPLILSGTFLAPSDLAPITQSISNMNEYSDYTFNLIPSTQIPTGGTLEITFPSQFSLGLGVNIDPNAATYCNTPCGITNYIVSFQIESACLPGVTSSFTIYSVLNPSYKGGTGSFIVRSKKGVNILDENLVFGVVGIADSISNLTSATIALDSTGSSSAGVLTKYSFSFKTNQLIPWNSYFMITVPASAGFIISKNPSCSAFAINGNIISGTLSCSSQGNNIIVQGLAADIPLAFEVGISVSITNPTVSGTTGMFRVAILRTNTNVVYAWNTAITGVTITPGSLSKVTFSQINTALLPSMGKWMDYRLIFIPKNALPLGSQIYIELPANDLTNCYIEYGITDIDPDTPSTPCVKDSSNSLLISGYQAMTTPGEISLTVRMQNPLDSGITTPVKIYTYKDSSQTIIDQDVTTAKTTIKNIQSTSLSSTGNVVISGANTLADSAPCSLTFSINPSTTVPANGYIHVYIPSEFTISSITAADCTMSGSASSSCSKTDQLIIMRMPSTVSFNIAATSTFQITNLKIKKPVYAGSFLFDITTYSSDGVTILDSYSQSLQINANTLSIASFLLIGKQVNRKGILRVDFTTLMAIPSGTTQTKVTDIKGVIQLEFTGSWANDLGTGLSDGSSLPCTSSFGILPLAGTNLVCTLYKKTEAFIEIKNFQALATGSVCRIYIANLLIASSQIKLNLIKRYNRVDLILNSYSTTPSTSAGSQPLSNTPKTFYFSETYVSEIFDLHFDMDQSQPIASGDSLLIQLPTFDLGFLQDESMVTCFVGVTGTTPKAYECIKFAIIDWILIFITDTYASTPPVTIYLNNLKWPRYAYSTGVSLFIFHYNNNAELEYKQYGAFVNVPVYKGFLSASLSIAKKGKGYPDCAYYFKFKAINSIPNGGTVVLTFPGDYSLQSSFPSPSFAADQFSGYNGNPLVFTPVANVLTISNIAEFPEKSLFTIAVKGIKNPSPLLDTSSGWTIEANYAGSIINKQTNFDFFQYGNDYSPGTIIFNSISAFPQNALVLADYSIEFTPNTPIPALGIIAITFPSAQFNNLPSNPVCKISGGLQTFSSCSLSGTTVTIITDSEYTTGSLTVTIKDVTNPQAGLTDGFEIITFYDNSFLDTTDDSDDSYRTILILPQASPITVNSIDFEPKNEGETSVYTFIFLPTTNINRNMEILIQFPSNYDDLIGTEVICKGLSGIVGDFTISIVEKKVFISGLDNYSPSNDNPLTIVIYNVENPNRVSNVGKFRIATFYSNTKVFIDYNENIEAFEMNSAPGWLALFNISASNYYARLPSNYTFSFTISKTLPKATSLGEILIDFPSDFDIPDKNLTCTYTPSDIGNLSCKISRNRVSASGNTDPFTGQLAITFENINNPPLLGSIASITVLTYDAFNKYIIERSYPNLDPFSFNYSYSGPLITVNDDEDIIVERGTQTQDLYISLDYPCALYLNFSTSTTEFSLFPSFIYMNLGDLRAVFRVSVPMSLTEGTYYIVWVTQGDDAVSPLYTPLKKTKVLVTNLKNVPIDISEIASVPYGGTSLAITVSLTYSPNIGIEIVANLDEDYPGISLSKKNIIFSAGDNQQSFEILYSNDSTVTNGTLTSTGGITLILSGVNKNTYSLSSYHLNFLTMSANVNSPALTELVAETIGQTYCNIIIGSNEIVMAYYMVALTGTTSPTYQEVVNKGPILYTTTRKQYGSVYIDSTNRVTVTINDLDAQTPYTIYIYLKNRGENVNKIKTYDFQTLDRYPAAQFSLQFSQSYLNEAEKNSTIKNIAFILSLPVSNVIQQNFTFASRLLDKERRELATTESASSTLALQIYSVTNSSNYPSPLQMAQLLRNKTSELSTLLTNFDSSYYIPTSNFVAYIPSFVETPTVAEIDQYFITIQAKLNNFGHVYAIAINATEDKSKPTSFQIYNGYNSENLICQSGNALMWEAYSYNSFKIENLVPDTQYNIYITGGSVHPGYPDLMDDKSIVLIAVQTKPLIICKFLIFLLFFLMCLTGIVDPLDINIGRKLESGIVVYLMVVLVGIFILDL